MINSNAQTAIRKGTHRVAKKDVKTILPKGITHKETSQLPTEKSSDTGSGFETSVADRTKEGAKLGVSRRMRKNGMSSKIGEIPQPMEA